MEEDKIAVIGAGLVGSLEASLLGNRGMKVDLYESREDIRKMEHVQGRSINLALSVRGRAALKAIGLEEKVIKGHAIPMKGRLIHGKDGRRKAIPYGKDDQCIYSVGRRFLNEILLTNAENNPNVSVHFAHKLVSCDLQKGSLVFKRSDTEKTLSRNASLIVGCDGAYSTVRRQMLKETLFDYSQTYIPHGYLELSIPPVKQNGQFAMEVNYLHIWPRGQFMMIALPNQDKSYTVTLFAPFELFEQLNNSEKLLNFFNCHFEDAVQLITQEKLVDDYFRMKPSPVVSVKCSPYHIGQRVVILGDAAHAMVPFYGQGLNAGFEDCLILNEFLDSNSNNIGAALKCYSEFRKTDAQAICDLAMYNYIEMRDLVNSKSFLLRKKVDNLLHWLLGEKWIPLYSMVTFSRTRYHQCVENRKYQDRVIKNAGRLTSILGISLLIGLSNRYVTKKEISNVFEKAFRHFSDFKK